MCFLSTAGLVFPFPRVLKEVEGRECEKVANGHTLLQQNPSGIYKVS